MTLFSDNKEQKKQKGERIREHKLMQSSFLNLLEFRVELICHDGVIGVPIISINS
jgi:hypothetical protein